MTAGQAGTSLRWRVAQWLELRWWKRYLQPKDPAAYLRWKKQYWTDFLGKLHTLPALDSLHILDAGCGPAGIFMALEKNTVTALDPLLEQYAAELPHFRPKDYPYVQFKAQPLEALDETAAYDITFCLNAINHVSDIQACFDRLVNATRPGGYVVVSIDAHRHRWLMPLFQLLPGDVLHPHQYDLEGYRQFLTNRHCTITEEVLVKRERIFDYWVLVAKKQV